MNANSGMDNIPSRIDLMNPALNALRTLGGSASIYELLRQVIKDLQLSPEVIDAARQGGSKTDLAYRLAWTRSYLKKLGLIDNSQRGVWSLTKKGQDAKDVDPSDAVNITWGKDKDAQGEAESLIEGELIDSFDGNQADWRAQLLDILRGLDPSAFERVCQRLLREAGFTEVEVTGQSGDGGIDGKGIIRLGGFISFPILFQCKRYKGNVRASEVRDFRGAMAGRASKGIFITTSGFTADAYLEATRDGVEPIDLINGELLADRMKELGLGVTTKSIEVVEIDQAWFDPMRSEP